MSERVEIVASTCPWCGLTADSQWVPGSGCLPSSDYVLVADWVYHAKCWDEQVANTDLQTGTKFVKQGENLLFFND